MRLLYTENPQNSRGENMDAGPFTQNTFFNEATEPPQILPHNIEAEQELLGAILINNEAYTRVLDIIDADCFFDPLHHRIFSKSAQQILAGRLVSPVTLKEFFENEEPVGELSVSQYLGRLAANATSIINAEGYAERIKSLHHRRQAILIGQDLAAQSYDPDTPSETAVESAQSALDKLGDHGGRKENTQSSLAAAAANAIEELKDPTQNNTISTSLTDLDRALGGGWPRGELTIVAARPSVGKSAFIASSMMRSAKQGYEMLCFSMEMQKEALAARCLSDFTYTRENTIPYAGILGKRTESYQWDRLERAQKDFADYALEIDDQRGLTVANIQSRIRRHINKLDRDGRQLDLIVVDHLGKIQADNYRGARHLELGAMTEQLAVIAGNFNVAVVVLCQLNRAVEGRDNKRPTLADLRESGRIEEDANTVIMLHRPGYYLEREKHEDFDQEIERQEKLKKIENDFEAIILKQRNGVCRPVDLWCNMATNSIRDKGRM